MLCTVYRSTKNTGVYLYLVRDFDWNDLPEELTSMLGHCEVAMQLNLNKHSKLASEDIDQVRKQLKDQGFHLQLPPQITHSVIHYG